jgi:hypothetical protein
MIQKLMTSKTIALLISQCHQQLPTDCWKHSACPFFNPERLPNDFHIFGSLKKDFKGKCFKCTDEVGAMANVMVWWLALLLHICEVLASNLIVSCQATTSVSICKIRILQLEVV